MKTANSSSSKARFIRAAFQTPGQTALATLAQTGFNPEWTNVLVTVAYATRSGVEQFVGQLISDDSTWTARRKRFLFSLDYGVTEPEAIEYVMGLNHADCRIFSGDVVIGRRLRPVRAFHPKVYLFGNSVPLSKATRLSAVVGSCNLTNAALQTNIEAYCVLEAERPNDLGNLVTEMEALYASSQPADKNLVARYRKVRTKTEYDIDRPASPPARGDIDPESSRALQSATSFWTQTRKITRNRGTKLPGNEVDLRKGVRVFWGCKAAPNTPKNSHLMTVKTRINGSPPIERELRYNDNGMDVLSLPIPEEHGIDSYENCYLVWHRDADGTYTLTVQNSPGDLLDRSNRTGAIVSYAGGKRHWGYFT